MLGAPCASTRTEWIHPFSTLCSKYLHGVPWGFNPSKCVRPSFQRRTVSWECRMGRS